MSSRFLALALACCCVTPAFAADKRVYKIDSLIATARGGMVTIQAKGAVQSGGWKKPKLHVLHVDAHAVTVEFVAAPPPAGMTVIEAVVPVEATAKVRGKSASVRVLADANEMTAQILK